MYVCYYISHVLWPDHQSGVQPIQFVAIFGDYSRDIVVFGDWRRLQCGWACGRKRRLFAETVAAFDDRLVVHTADKLSPFPASPFSAIIFASVDEA